MLDTRKRVVYTYIEAINKRTYRTARETWIVQTDNSMPEYRRIQTELKTILLADVVWC